MEHAAPLLHTLVIQFCGFLFLLAIVRHYSRNSLLPTEAWLMVIGISYGLIRRHYFDWLPEVILRPDLLFVFILPLLIFASGRLIRLSELRAQMIPVSFFAFIGVIASMFLIGAPIAYLLGIRLIDGLFLGAAVSATDPGAVSALLKRFKLPERLGLIIEGESLLNDGLAVVVYTVCATLALTSATLNLTDVTIKFSWAVLGAIPIGWLFGWLIGKILDMWGEYYDTAELTLSLFLALGVYLVAEELLHISGVITVLFSAIAFVKVRYQVRRDHGREEQNPVFGPFWAYLSMALNSFLFFVLGAETGAHDFPITWIFAQAVLILVVSRAIIVYFGSGVLRGLGARLPFSWQNVLMLTGLRGAISVALILMMPVDYEYRTFFLCIAYVMNLIPLLIQPAILQTYLNRIKIPH